MAPRRHHSVLCIALLVLSACAAGTSAVEQASAQAEKQSPIDIGVRTTNDDWIEIATLRKQPLLLFVFATFDGTSQAVLRSLRSVVSHRPDLRVIGVAAQPDAKLLLDAWANALDPPFIVGFDPTDSIQEGLTALGELESVPALVFLDVNGFEQGRLLGFQPPQAIDTWLNTMQKP